MVEVIITDRRTNKVKKFKSYYTASLWLVFKWLTTKNEVYRDLINSLLWYWETGATKVEFKIGGKQ